GLDALVTEDALRVVADVELVVDLHRLLDRERIRAEAIGPSLVAIDVPESFGRGGEISGGAEQLEHEPPAGADALRVGVHHHPVLDLARTGGNERPRLLELDHADAANVDRGQCVPVAERRRVDADPPARVENRRALGHAHGLAVDGQLDDALRGRDRDGGHWASTPRLWIAESTAFAAVWPRPQIEASRITCVRSPSTASSSPCGLPEASRCSASSWRTVPMRHGTH